MPRRRVRKATKAVKGAVAGAAPTLGAVHEPETEQVVAVTATPVPLAPVVLLHQVGLMWPKDGRRHYYGPGAVQLPREIVNSLSALRHRVVAR